MKQNNEIAGIGLRIKQARKELRVRQKEMAETLGISSNYLSEIENGKANPGPEIFLKLASAYNMNLQYLFLGKDAAPSFDKDYPGITGVDITREIDSVEKLNWLMNRSPYIKNSILAFASRLLYENREMVQFMLTETINKKEK